MSSDAGAEYRKAKGDVLLFKTHVLVSFHSDHGQANASRRIAPLPPFPPVPSRRRHWFASRHSWFPDCCPLRLRSPAKSLRAAIFPSGFSTQLQFTYERRSAGFARASASIPQSTFAAGLRPMTTTTSAHQSAEKPLKSSPNIPLPKIATEISSSFRRVATTADLEQTYSETAIKFSPRQKVIKLRSTNDQNDRSFTHAPATDNQRSEVTGQRSEALTQPLLPLLPSVHSPPPYASAPVGPLLTRRLRPTYYYLRDPTSGAR
jgi:hypothetical protein